MNNDDDRVLRRIPPRSRPVQGSYGSSCFEAGAGGWAGFIGSALGSLLPSPELPEAPGAGVATLVTAVLGAALPFCAPGAGDGETIDTAADLRLVLMLPFGVLLSPGVPIPFVPPCADAGRLGSRIATAEGLLIMREAMAAVRARW